MAFLRSLTAALSLVALTACGSASANNQSAADRTTPTTVPSGPSVAALHAFRDAAAAAPYWNTVDWTAPTTIEQAARGFDRVVIAVVRSATIDAPRSDRLVPYEGAPTLYHLEVTLQADPRGGSATTTADALHVRVPVLASGAEGLGTGRPYAERIAAAAPVGATGVFLIDTKQGFVQPVAFESNHGDLIAYFRFMDAAVAHLTSTQLANALVRTHALTANRHA